MNNPTTIDVLDDNLLTQILVRLPCCASVLVCTAVKKHWCCLITNPKFGELFYNFKKERSSIDDDEPPWTFISRMAKYNEFPQIDFVGNTSNNEAVFGHPKFSMGYLPWGDLVSTYKDLVLCSSTPPYSLIHLSPHRDYCITNPLTKQWVSLPPFPTSVNDEIFCPWVALVCQHPYGYTQDYKFRVVVMQRYPPPVYGLVVFCSEIGEWKEFKLGVPINRELTDHERDHTYDNRYEGVVCNGIIYLYHKLYFAAFNPFDVDETTNTSTIEAKLLPSLPYQVDGYLRESSGQLFLIHDPNGRDLCYIKHGRAIEFPLKVWKLDPNLVPLIWKTAFEGSCAGNLNQLEPPSDTDPIRESMLNSYLGMHPNNDKLIYMYLCQESHFVMCDTRIGLMKPSKSIAGYYFSPFHRLALQWWPTSVPKAYLPNASQSNE